MSLRSSLSAALLKILPVATRTIVRGKQQPSASSHLMDVDLLHSYLRHAEQGDTSLLFGLYRDILASHAHTQAEFNKRKLAVLGEPLTFLAKNPDDPAEVAWVAGLQNHFDDRPALMDFLSHSMDATMYPLAVSERTYQPSSLPGWRYELGEILPVPHVHLAWPLGELAIRDTDADGNFLGTFTQPNPARYVSHKGHLLSSVPDYWGGPMRALVFWWLFATMDRDWWARFLDRFGSPFLIGKYEETDDDARYSLESAFSAATRLFGMAVSKGTDVQMHQANSVGGGEAFENFQTFANSEISKLIVGQPGSASDKNPGLGGDGQAKAQSDVREDIKRYDIARLAHTIRTQILKPLKQINGWTFDLPTVGFGQISEEEADLTGDLIASLFQAGLEPDDQGLKILSKKLSLPLRRVQAIPAVALSSKGSLPLLPAVARRAARSQQARRAVATLTAEASPKLARLMRDRAQELAAAITDSDSPESAAAAIAALTSSYDPAAAADLISHLLTSASLNALLASD
jgi:phage gp29-like protein